MDSQELLNRLVAIEFCLGLNFPESFSVRGRVGRSCDEAVGLSFVQTLELLPFPQ
tara:strand:- start:558 stop:722 length:165 start_codon:yes stop_codon:yes gene_type:complete